MSEIPVVFLKVSVHERHHAFLHGLRLAGPAEADPHHPEVASQLARAHINFLHYYIVSSSHAPQQKLDPLAQLSVVLLFVDFWLDCQGGLWWGIPAGSCRFVLVFGLAACFLL